MYVAYTVDALIEHICIVPLVCCQRAHVGLGNISNKEDNIPLSEADRPAFKQLWELFLIAYEGYFGFTLSTLVCIYKIPESIPIFANSLFGLYGYKMYALRVVNLGQKNDAQYKSKVTSIALFFCSVMGATAHSTSRTSCASGSIMKRFAAEVR
eukprot:scaffold1341_cov178-Amphora_coffeaeformis.AAC.33